MKSRFVMFCAAAIGAVVMWGCAPTPTALVKYDQAKASQKKANDMSFRDAIAKYKQFMADPQNKDSTLLPYAQYNIALCYKGLYDNADAIAAYKEVVSKWPTSEPAHWADPEMRDLEKNPLVAPTTTMKPTTTVKRTTTTMKATSTTMKPMTKPMAKPMVTTTTMAMKMTTKPGAVTTTTLKGKKSTWW